MNKANNSCHWGWFVDPAQVDIAQPVMLRRVTQNKSVIKHVKTYSSFDYCDSVFEMEITHNRRYVDKEVILKTAYVFCLVVFCCKMYNLI